MGEIVDYIEKNRSAGGLYISINGEELTQGFSKVCERLVSVEYIQQDESRSLDSSARNLEQQYLAGDVGRPIGNSPWAGRRRRQGRRGRARRRRRRT
jgi:hypothetical protein